MRRKKHSEEIKRLQNDINTFYKRELVREVFKLTKIFGGIYIGYKLIRHGAALVSKVLPSEWYC